jgi:hypothetical protein
VRRKACCRNNAPFEITGDHLAKLARIGGLMACHCHQGCTGQAANPVWHRAAVNFESKVILDQRLKDSYHSMSPQKPLPDQKHERQAGASGIRVVHTSCSSLQGIRAALLDGLEDALARCSFCLLWWGV